MREDEGDDEEEMPLQPAPGPLTLHQAAEHLRAPHDFGLFINQPQFTAKFARQKNCLKLNNAEKQTAF